MNESSTTSWYWPYGLYEEGISWQTMININLVLTGVLTAFVSFFGFLFNLVNIAVFIKQGSFDSVNVPLLGLAVSDAGASLSLFVYSLQYSLLFSQHFGFVDLTSVMNLTVLWPHVLFTRVTCWITVFITFERYLCIALPLKVKIIINRKRTIAAVVAIFVVMVTSVAPVLIACRLGSVDIFSNFTMLSIIYSAECWFVENIVVSFNAFAEIAAFIGTALLTFALVEKFTERTTWRRNTSTSADYSQISDRDRKVIKMVIIISTTFILSYTPSVCATICLAISKDYVNIRFTNAVSILWAIALFTESINSMITIFVYMRMSSRYRMVFLNLFGMSHKI